MVYLSDKASGSGDMKMKRFTTEGESQLKKTCADCGTGKTPLWRSGPAGPKSLCNACGIKSRKKRRPTPSDKKDYKRSRNDSPVFSGKEEDSDREESDKEESDKEENVNGESDKESGEEESNKEQSCREEGYKEEMAKDELTDMVTRIKMVLRGEESCGTSGDKADSNRCDFGEEERAAILLMALSFGILSN